MCTDAEGKKSICQEQTFLSFPISPLPYTPSQLDFFDQANAEALLQCIHRRKDFSTLVDGVPTGEAWQPAGDVRILKLYSSVLQTAELASPPARATRNRNIRRLQRFCAPTITTATS